MYISALIHTHIAYCRRMNNEHAFLLFLFFFFHAYQNAI